MAVTDYLGRITPAGQITEIPLSGPGDIIEISGSVAGGFAKREITFGLDGNLWFADFGPNEVRRITPTGVAVKFSLPAGHGGPDRIVAGPDGHLWFNELYASQIGRFRIAGTDLEVSISAPAEIVTAFQPTTYTIRVTNHGPVAATDVVLSEEASFASFGNSRSISASQGNVEARPGTRVVVELGELAIGATATIVVTDTQPTLATSRWRAHANESDTNGANDKASLTATIDTGSSSAAPQVLALRSIRAKRKGLTAVVVHFDQPMDPARVQDTGIYHLVMVPKGKKARVKAVRIASATYDAATRSVRLTLSKPVKTGVLRLTIDGSGTVAADGSGISGGDYVARVPR